ncbi:fungal-specific transcription factor domain-containing protein [Aspergillus ambiguus]|uniref:Zn(II)2Cys6 transcription factor n=1 Tax=Aspergillus ambiguus TaxID=176160 RepID=UPI003CCCEAD4
MPAVSKKKSAVKKVSIDSSVSVSSSSEGTPAGTVEKSAKMHKRSRSGCFTCRLRRKKCDEKHPSCSACINLCVKCEYKRPVWWANAEQRKLHKEKVKNMIKQTKLNERNGTIGDPNRSRTTALSPTSPDCEFPEQYDMFSSQMPNSELPQQVCGTFGPYEIDVKTERQTYINDIPLRHDSTSSTFSTFAPPQLNATLPPFATNEWFHEECFPGPPTFSVPPALPGLDPALSEQNLAQTYDILQSNIPVSEHDRPLLNHFIHNVLRMIFPVLEAHNRGHIRAQAILQALETNKCYLHCCLSVSAIHLKTTESGLDLGEQIDHDIMRHRFEAISQLCLALGEDSRHEEILDATLAMIFFHCSVGSTDDYLPDIPWYDHFQAASNLVNRLGLPNAVEAYGSAFPPFSMTLTSWIDILGSTIHGKTPEFAHTYRSKHLSGSSSGLRELMGCDDRVMYLISEITCLDALKSDGRIDEMAVCSHVSALGRQLEFTEPADQTLENPYTVGPYTPSGVLRADILTKNITAVFRIAARIYLCSLIPGFDRNQASSLNLVAAMVNTLQFIPSGLDGFDRSLVWPLLITGVYSAPSSEFRSVLAERAAALGQHAELGSFGRMYRVLQEVWRVTDDPIETFSTVKESPDLASPVKLEASASPRPNGAEWGPPEPKKLQIHWRDVLKQNGWNFLLI